MQEKLSQAIKAFVEESEDSANKFIEVGEVMLSAGIPFEKVVSLLEDLYSAALVDNGRRYEDIR